MRSKDKSELLELCEKYRRSGLACVESVIRTIADYYDIKLSGQILKGTCAFAGGAAGDDRCGVLEAGVAILTELYYKGKMRCDVSIDELLVNVQKNFERNLGSLLCSKLFYPVYDEYMKTHENEDDFRCVFNEGLLSNIEYIDENIGREDTSPELSEMETELCGDIALRKIEKKFDLHFSKEISRLAGSYSKGSRIGGRCTVLQLGYLTGGIFFGRTSGSEPRDRLRQFNKKLYSAFCDEMGFTDCKLDCDHDTSCEICSNEVIEKATDIVVRVLKEELDEEYCRENC